MGKFVWDSFSGVSGLKTALVKIRTVLSHSEAVKRLQKHFVNMRSTNHMERSQCGSTTIWLQMKALEPAQRLAGIHTVNR